MSHLSDFINKNYKHFNAASLVDAAQGWVQHINSDGKMMLAMAGAMSTAEIGISLAEMIRTGNVHAICTTGANLEEDIYNLIAHSHYKRVPGYRSLSAEEEMDLRDSGWNRVTDTCIPEEEALRKLEGKMISLWKKAAEEGESYFPYEYFYELIRTGALKADYEIDPSHSWVVAACERDIPIFTPGWEDSTLGNMIVANHMKGDVSTLGVVKLGLQQMQALVNWYRENSASHEMGIFQIGGGIAGDFSICVVPLLIQDLKEKDTKLWNYFAQISDSTTSYGSYSGAVPNEKITWYKLSPSSKRFIIESDASIVAPLIFNYVLEN